MMKLLSTELVSHCPGGTYCRCVFDENMSKSMIVGITIITVLQPDHCIGKEWCEEFTADLLEEHIKAP